MRLTGGPWTQKVRIAVRPDELPALPVDIIDQINAALAAFGYADEKAEPVVSLRRIRRTAS